MIMPSLDLRTRADCVETQRKAAEEVRQERLRVLRAGICLECEKGSAESPVIFQWRSGTNPRFQCRCCGTKFHKFTTMPFELLEKCDESE
jgi:hypothetical protein